MHVSWYMCRSQRKALESLFFFHPGFQGLELRLASMSSSVALHLIL